MEAAPTQDAPESPFPHDLKRHPRVTGELNILHSAYKEFQNCEAVNQGELDRFLLDNLVRIMQREAFTRQDRDELMEYLGLSESIPNWEEVVEAAWGQTKEAKNEFLRDPERHPRIMRELSELHKMFGKEKGDLFKEAMVRLMINELFTTKDRDELLTYGSLYTEVENWEVLIKEAWAAAQQCIDPQIANAEENKRIQAARRAKAQEGEGLRAKRRRLAAEAAEAKRTARLEPSMQIPYEVPEPAKALVSERAAVQESVCIALNRLQEWAGIEGVQEANRGLILAAAELGLAREIRKTTPKKPNTFVSLAKAIEHAQKEQKERLALKLANEAKKTPAKVAAPGAVVVNDTL